jgi:hypothetical protein
MAQTQPRGTIVQIEADPAIASRTILAALEAEGVEALVVDVDPLLELDVADGDLRRLAARVSAALEDVIRDCELPLVPEQVGPSSFVLRPAAG